MPLWHAALLGLVQGLTEFLPVSSTAHLVAVRAWLGHPTPDDAFTTVVQMGTLAAVWGYFRRELLAVLRAVWADAKLLEVGSTPLSRLGWLIVLGSLPAGFAGLLLKKWLKANFYTLPAMGVVAIVFALLMLAAELWARRRPGRGEETIGVRDALWVGGWQALALMPGGSRSGATITGGLFAGLSREAATRFSFLLSVPIITAAGLKELLDERKTLLGSGDQAAVLGVGLVVAAATGYLAIYGLLAFLRRYSTGVFVGYRLVFGVALILLGGEAGGGRKPPDAATEQELSSLPQAAPGGLRPPPASDAPLRGRILWPAKLPLPTAQPVTDAQWPGVPPGTTNEDLRVDAVSRGVRDVVVWLADDPVNRSARPLREGLPEYTPTDRPVRVGPAQFAPRILTARAGDTLKLSGMRATAADGTDPPAGPLKATAQPLALTAPAAGWMRGWVWAFDHPFYAVTGPDGRFELPAASPGPRKLVVWHELGYHRNFAGGLPVKLPAAELTVELELP